MKPKLHHLPRILIIDKDEDDFRFFKEAISKVSSLIPVWCSAEIDRLLDVVDQARPSLIFIEYRLPRENGIQCVERLKAHPVFRSIPVIMWSSGSVVSVVADAYRAGIQLYLEKPWDIDTWVNSMRQVLQPEYGQPLYSSALQAKKQTCPV